MTFKTFIMKQELTTIEVHAAKEICKDWKIFSNTIGTMNKSEVIKILRYLVEFRPHSKTLGQRAIQRFNTLNKVSWRDLANGN